MPLSESSYLPPAAFILSHVLGIAGVLYWRSRSGAGRGEALKWLAWGRVGARCGKDGRTDRRGAGRREEAPGRAGLAVPKLGLSPPGGSAEGGAARPRRGGEDLDAGASLGMRLFFVSARAQRTWCWLWCRDGLSLRQRHRDRSQRQQRPAETHKNPQKPTETLRNPQWQRGPWPRRLPELLGPWQWLMEQLE